MEQDTNTTLLPAKRDFSRLGWALLAMSVSATLMQFLLAFLFELLISSYPALMEADWLYWLMTFLPIYLVAMPLGIAMMKKIPAAAVSPAPLGAKRFAGLLLMCFPIMYGGNLLGNLLSYLFSGGNAQNGLMNFVMGNPLYTLLVAVIVAPMAEEYIFRKLLMDRCARYGEVTAILLSGFTFGLFHMNLFQFFYTFGLGILFAYAYQRTGMLRYPVILHMTINFVGSVVAPWFLSNLDPRILTGEITDLTLLMDQLPFMALYMLYSGLLMIVSIAGLVLLISRWKKRQFFPAPQELPSGIRAKTVLLRPSMILFVLFCIINIVLALFLT